MSELKRNINSRSYLRGQVTKIFNSRAEFCNLSPLERSTKQIKLETILHDLKDVDKDIQSIKWAESENKEEFDKELASCEEYFDKATECLSLLASFTNQTSTVTIDHARSILKSPIAPLPKFGSKEGEDLTKFLFQFEETLSKFNYTDYDKLLLLKQQISGKALTLVESLEIDKQSYVHAKALLQSALASPVTQKHSVIKRISEMKLSLDQEPFEYVSKMRTLTESVKALNIDTESFLEYFFWNGLNDSFKSHIVHITNKTKPSLNELNESFFDACERYNVANKKTKLKNVNNILVDNVSASSFAANVNLESKSMKKYKSCQICSKDNGKDADHPIYRCPVYEDPMSKLEKIKNLSGCEKCGNLNHRTKACKFKFNRRCTCSQWHFSYLCVKSKPNDKPAPKYFPGKQQAKNIKNGNKITSGNVTITDALSNVLNTDCVLPTFTCNLNYRIQIRSLKDGGCQCNFISERLAEEYDLKVVQSNVNLKVNGFNATKDYVTNIVEFSIDVGGKSYSIKAVCVPEISINLKLPNLSRIVEQFTSKGYIMADKKLYEEVDSITNIDLILGTKSAYCVKGSDKSFGINETSIYTETSFGVMLIGDVNDLLKNLPQLPECASYEEAKCCTYKIKSKVKDKIKDFSNKIGARTSFSYQLHCQFCYFF